MDINQLLAQSLQLLALGMGSVFVILTLLIVIISVISKLVPEEPAIKPPQNTTIPPKIDTQHIAAIQAAIHQFRHR